MTLKLTKVSVNLFLQHTVFPPTNHMKLFKMTPPTMSKNHSKEKSNFKSISNRHLTKCGKTTPLIYAALQHVCNILLEKK